MLLRIYRTVHMENKVFQTGFSVIELNPILAQEITFLEELPILCIIINYSTRNKIPSSLEHLTAFSCPI